MRVRYSWLVLGLMAAGLAACGSSTGLTLGRVQGKVTYKGQPVQNGTVVFLPDETKGTTGPTGMGSINKDGEYVLSTSDSSDGAVVGAHKVGITGLELNPVNDGSASPRAEPSTDSLGYLKGKALASKQARQSRPKATDEETFTDRGGRTFRYVIPKKLGSPEGSGIIAGVSRGSNTINLDVKEDGTVEVSH